MDAAQAMLLSHQADGLTGWLGQQAANSDIACTAGPVSTAAAARVTAVQSTFQLYHSGST